MGLPFLLLGCATPPGDPVPPPLDTPPWSTAKWVQWAPMTATGHRAIVIDMPGGALDQRLTEPEATLLNDRFAPVFLHPRARPSLTSRVGWPSITLVDPQGCVVATQENPEDVIGFLNHGLSLRGTSGRPLPPARQFADPGSGDFAGTWTADVPGRAPFDPVRGPAAVVWQGKGYVYGNLFDAQALLSVGRTEARSWVAAQPPDLGWPTTEGPDLSCVKGSR